VKLPILTVVKTFGYSISLVISTPPFLDKLYQKNKEGTTKHGGKHMDKNYEQKNTQIEKLLQLGAEIYDKSNSAEAVMYLAYAWGIAEGNKVRKTA